MHSVSIWLSDEGRKQIENYAEYISTLEKQKREAEGKPENNGNYTRDLKVKKERA